MQKMFPGERNILRIFPIRTRLRLDTQTRKELKRSHPVNNIAILITCIISSVTRLGDFWKFLMTNFLTKVAQIYVKTFWAFWMHPVSSVYCCGYFLGKFRIILGCFIFQRLVTLKTSLSLSLSIYLSICLSLPNMKIPSLLRIQTYQVRLNKTLVGQWLLLSW